MRTDSNRIAIRAVRSVIDAAQPLELDVAGTQVTCAVSFAPPAKWPTNGLAGIDEATDGQWPRTAVIQATWDGGKCTLEMWCSHSGQGEISLTVVVVGTSSAQVVWTNIARRISDAEDGDIVHVPADAYTKKRKVNVAADVQTRVNQLLAKLVGGSAIPRESQWRIRAFDVEVPSGAVAAPAAAFRHLVHLALFKLDFIAGGALTKERGRPLIDIAKLTGITPSAPELAPVDADNDEDDAKRPRRYWAGGGQWGNESKREEFIAGNYWKVGWSRAATEAPARTTWRRFDEIQAGDLFAIKGLGGEHDLLIHYVGEVLTVDATAGQLTLKKLDTPTYSGKAPKGGGAGNWFDTLVPITRRDVIEMIFGTEAANTVAPSHDYDGIPLNLILYGPPGTGKTYALSERYFPRFTRREREIRDTDAAADAVTELTYFEVIVAAIASAPGQRASVAQILEHPLAKAKYQTNAPKSMRQIVWGTLGQHAVEESKTVKMKRRLGELVFDKDSEGRWFFPNPLPPELKDTVERATRRGSAPKEVKDYDFVTFHQAYSYEDFIEGIRPNVTPGVEELADGGVGYALRDGVFKEAVRKALQRTKFGGTIHDLCSLPRHERTSIFDGVPHFAIFIDEINRGNVARVLGELITLLEDDKRLGADNELIVRLPYSGTLFGVPPNLHVIGTMNTADRSVEALDAALRRRFDFEELPPRPEELDFTVDGPIDLRRMLQTINRRLERLRDRDHCIGHAYFMSLEKDPTLDALQQIFATKVLPLLQEYFFGDWGKIGLVLGKEFVQQVDDGIEFARFDHDDRDSLMRRPVYKLTPPATLTDHAFRRIYEDVADDA